MKAALSNGIYRSKWNDCHINFFEGKNPQMSGFHMHDFYEIHLILSGNLNVLFSDASHQCTAPLIILNKPHTPHFLSSQFESHYSRYCLLFSEDFVANYIPKWNHIATVFGKTGNIIHITQKQAEEFTRIIKVIKNETSSFRKRLLIYYILSYILELSENTETITDSPPQYVLDAISYIDENFAEKIVASDLAWQLNIGRTTLMTAFKKYTGNTLNNYVTRRRLYHAIRLLNEGKTEQEVAFLCGFGGSYGLIRAFKKFYNLTPGQFIASNPLY